MMNNQVYNGDCLEVMRGFDDESVDLIYLDPPFFSQKTHALRTRDRKQEFSFKDLWSSHTEYARFIYERLIEMSRVLSSTGSLFFHCDRSASHLVRTLLDEVFGADMFRAEIIWYYRRWSNAQKGLLPAHQTIYYYTKSNLYTFNTVYQGYSASTNVDQLLQRRKRDKTGKVVYEKGKDGRIVPSGGKKGVPLRDVWDIPYLNPKAKERTGYPTQKPLLLLERIIKIASKENSVVLDPFCGSGTTLVAAVSLNRQAIGIDISNDACEITRQRLQQPVKTESRLLQQGRNSYRNADEKVLSLLHGVGFAPVQRNKGIDAVLKKDLNGKPILVRVQRADESILEAANRLYKASKRKGAAAMFVIATQRGGYFEFENQFPQGVTIIDAPALAITDSLAQFKGGNSAKVAQ